MVRTSILYTGDKRCELIHELSKAKMNTDAPRDNHGKGESFSPTDMVGAALGSCILTTMAIVGERDGLSLKGAKATVDKVMTDAPRRIAELRVQVELPASLKPEDRKKMEHTAEHCPVHRSLHPDVKIPMEFIYR